MSYLIGNIKMECLFMKIYTIYFVEMQNVLCQTV